MTETERFDSRFVGQVAYEHFHRYAIAQSYVANRLVADIACGQGYGSALLARFAERVIGIDVDAAAIEHAKKQYKRLKQLEFRLGDGVTFPVPDASVDMVVSFETIEHVEDLEQFARELKRILKPEGLLILSTPNKPVYNKLRRDPNPYHINEMTIDELSDLLSRQFTTIELSAQRMAVVSFSHPLDHSSNEENYRGLTVDVTPKGEVLGTHAGVVALPEPEYVLAFCSDGPITHPAPLNSIFVAPEEDLWMRQAEVLKWASGLHEEDEVLRARLQASTEEADELRQRLSQLDAEYREAAAGSLMPQQRAAIVEEELRAIGPLVSTLRNEIGTPATVPLLVDTLSKVATERAVTELKLQHLEEKQYELTRRAEQAESQFSRMQEEVRALSSALAERMAQVDVLATEREHESEKLQRAEELKIAVEASLALAMEQLSELKASQAAHEQARSRADHEVETARHALAAAEAELSNFTAEVERLSGELAQREVQIAAAAEERDRALRAAESLSVELDQSSAALATVQTEFRELSNTLPKYEKRIQELTDQEALDQEEIEALDAQNTSLSHQLAQGDLHRQALEKAFEGLAADHSKLRARSAKLTRTLARLRKHGGRNGVDTDPSQQQLQDEKSLRSAVMRVLALREEVILDQARSSRSVAAAFARAPDIEPIHSLDEILDESDRKSLIDSRLFDADWYLRQYQDVGSFPPDALDHYLTKGWMAGHQPSALFHGDWYLDRHLDILEARMCPLVHYFKFGEKEGRRPHPLFNPQEYLNRYADIAEAGVSPFSHFVNHGCYEVRIPDSLVENVLSDTPDRARQALMELLFSDGPASQKAARLLEATRNSLLGPWSPDPIDQYHLPQRLRDYIVDRFGEAVIDRYWYLFSIIDKHAGNPAGFDESDECRILAERAKALAQLPDDRKPEASIIIPAYNNLLYTLTSLVSLLELKSDAGFEIIVADDASSDATAAVIRSIGGVVHLARTEKNLGFLKNCNAAAGTARGDHIVLLNNDTIVLPGWLDQLLAPFDQHPDIGMAGSKLINGDGTLQEAGGIFWRDGSAWNFGRDQDPRQPEYNYLKDVDYCSGAAIALPRHVWRDLGGFDEMFEPAYCEDADLAFRVRDAGLRTIYVPQSQVVHHEGRSHGRDVTSGIKAHQVTNQRQLLTRWKAVLERDHFDNGKQVFLARDRSRSKPHILVIDHYVPQRDRDAGSRTIFQYMEMFVAAGFQVTLWPDNLNEDREYVPELQAMGIEVIYGPHYIDRFESWLAERAPYLNYVLFSRPHITKNYIGAVDRYPGIRKIYYGHDLHFMRIKRKMEISGATAALEEEAAKWEEIERDICRRCDVVLYPGHEEVELVREWVTSDTGVIDFPITIFSADEIRSGREHANRAAQNPFTLMFVGGFTHAPNVDGVLWFAREVFPLLKAADNRYRLAIAGSNAPAEVVALAGGGIDYLGRISDEELDALYEQSGAAVVPLLYGAGVKGKVIEAMAHGTPLAMTSVGGQGIADAINLAFVADDPRELAQQIRRIANEPSEARRRALAALDFIEAQFSADAVRRKLVDAIPELGGTATGPTA